MTRALFEQEVQVWGRLVQAPNMGIYINCVTKWAPKDGHFVKGVYKEAKHTRDSVFWHSPYQFVYINQAWVL